MAHYIEAKLGNNVFAKSAKSIHAQQSQNKKKEKNQDSSSCLIVDNQSAQNKANNKKSRKSLSLKTLKLYEAYTNTSVIKHVSR